MPPDSAAGSWPVRRCAALVVAALLLLISSAAGAVDARDAAPLPASTSSHTGEALGGRSSRTTTSTSRPPRQPSVDSSSVVLPLVLAAILFLSLLTPSTGYHSHGHWHGR